MRLQCKRTHHTTKTEKIETHKATLHHTKNLGWSIKLTPGVTGYESLMVHDIMRNDEFNDKPWCACAGTDGTWDKLEISAEEMARLRDILRLLPI